MSRPNTVPIFPGELNRTHEEISTANTNFDGSGTIAEVLECPTTQPNGYLIKKITVQAGNTGTTTSGQVKLFLSDDAGTNWQPWRSIIVEAITAAAATSPFWAQLDDQNDEELAGGLVLPSGWSLGAAPHNGETFEVHVEYGVL